MPAPRSRKRELPKPAALALLAKVGRSDGATVCRASINRRTLVVRTRIASTATVDGLATAIGGATVGGIAAAIAGTTVGGIATAIGGATVGGVAAAIGGIATAIGNAKAAVGAVAAAVGDAKRTVRDVGAAIGNGATIRDSAVRLAGGTSASAATHTRH